MAQKTQSKSRQAGSQAGFKYRAVNSGGLRHSADVHTADLHPQFQITAYIRLFKHYPNSAKRLKTNKSIYFIYFFFFCCTFIE